MTAQDFVDRLGQDWAANLTRQARTSSPHPYVYASSWRPCERRMVLDCKQPEPLPPLPAELAARFRRGDDRERDLLADLARIGRDSEPPFQVFGQQERFELRDHKGRVAIAGKVDAQLQVNNHRVPVEIKAWSPFLTDRIERFGDLFDNPWTRSGGYQLLSYLYGAAVPWGLLLLDRSGLPRLLAVELDANLDRMEQFLATAERVVDHLQAGSLPPYLEDDPAECRRCPWFGGVCNPPLAGKGATVLIDGALEAALERREQLKAPAHEYEELDSEVKQRLRGVEAAVIGSFSITGTWGKQSRVELPPALKRQYTVVNPRGRFTLDIARLEAR